MGWINKNLGYILAIIALGVAAFAFMSTLEPNPVDKYTTERRILELEPPEEFIEGSVLRIEVYESSHDWSGAKPDKIVVVFLCSGQQWPLGLVSYDTLHSIEHWAFLYMPKGCE